MKKLLIILTASLSLFMILQNEVLAMEKLVIQDEDTYNAAGQNLQTTTPHQSPQKLELKFIESEDDRPDNTNPVNTEKME